MSKHKKAASPLAEWRFGAVGSRHEEPPFYGTLSFRKDGTLLIHDEDGALMLVMALTPGTYIRRSGPGPAADPIPSGGGAGGASRVTVTAAHASEHEAAQ